MGPTLGGIPYGRGGYVLGPTGIGGLVAWYDAAQLPLNDNDSVASWTDLGAGGHHAVQATAAKKPLYKTNVVNGLPVLRFDGLDDFLLSDLFTLSQPLTVCVVATATVNATNIVDGGNALNTRIVQRGAASTTLRSYAGSFVTATTTSLASFFASVCVFNGAPSVINFNGTETTGDCGASNGTGITIGAGYNGGSPHNGDIAEVVLYAGAVSLQDRARLITYMKTKYAIA